jgi:hypothetical protein
VPTSVLKHVLYALACLGASPAFPAIAAILGAGDDRIFINSFEEAAAVSTAHYDDFDEGFLGTSFEHEGVTYRDLNAVAGAYPDGVPFAVGELGNSFIIETATFLYEDFPDFGSSPNALTFGDTFVNGDNLSIGPLASAWLDMQQLSSAVSIDIAYYENGPWGGVEIGLDAYRNGLLVGSDALTIADNDPSRDNVTTATLSIEGVEFDSLHLRALLDAIYTAPRVMVDDLELTQLPIAL